MRDFHLQRQRSYMHKGQAPLEYAKFTEWLEKYEVRFTPEAMAFLLQAMGTSTFAMERDGTIEVDAFVRACQEFEAPPPIVVVPSSSML